MKEEVKVGFFVLLGIVAFATSIFLLGDFNLKERYPIYVVFKDIGGLADKSNVKLNGVEVGQIKEIRIKDDKIIVKIMIDRDVKIFRDAKFYIGSTSIIGSKFIQIQQGKPSSGIIKEGEYVNAVERKPLEETLVDVADRINKLIADLDSKGEFTRNLNDTVKNLRDITANLNELIASNSSNISDITEKLNKTMDNINSLTTKLDSILTKVDNGEGTVGTLISDTTTQADVRQSIANIKEATKSLKDYLTKVKTIRTYWVWDYKYEPNARESYNNVGLKIFVNDSKYYYAGASNIINIKNRPRGTSYEIKNTVDAYIGWSHPLWEFYAGAIRGTGGFGLRYTPFYNSENFTRNISLIAEANEFARNRYIKGRFFNDARYDFGLKYSVNDKFSANIKITDILEVKRLNIGTTVMFEDKDIAYLLGFVGGAGTNSLVK